MRVTNKRGVPGQELGVCDGIVCKGDLLAFDPELKLLYVSAESGNVTVYS
jgi:hypothetical protein